MKTFEETQYLFNKTLEFIIRNIESEKDFGMLKTAMQDYQEMGYSTKEFEFKYKTYLEMFERVYDGNDLDFMGVKF